MNFAELPMGWYLDKLRQGATFRLQLWGDGEFLAASGRAVGRTLQNGEVVTDALALALRDALADPHPQIVRGTDRSLLFPESYGGRDVDSVRMHASNAAECARLLGKRFPRSWVDGTVWDVEVREGRLGPLLRVLRDLRTVVVGHPSLEGALSFLRPERFVPIPASNAFAGFRRTTEDLFAACRGRPCPRVVLLCMGLGAVPLMHALAAKDNFEGATWLDLGSTLDLFAGLGGDRGWRAEAYADESRRLDLLRRNLEGVA